MLKRNRSMSSIIWMTIILIGIDPIIYINIINQTDRK